MEGIKEIKEVLAAVEVVLVAAKKVAKDGKVDLKDAAVIVEVGAQLPVLIAAVEGLEKIPAEAKDIQAEEALELVGVLYAMAKKVQES